MSSQKLGPYELIRVLGRGGMGTVYEAKEKGANELVAVKALSPAYSFDEHFRSRFESEIDALMKLDHENIVQLLAFGQEEGVLFFAMELVDGQSLFQEQKKGQVFHWSEVIDIAVQVCEGLRHAHDRGIIHRDLKPGNLMVDNDRNIKITDFGIAKSFGSSSLTSEGNVLGTMDFMAPEQARGQPTTVRTDIFSLGAVMYSLLAGRPPFLQKTIEQTFESLMSPDPPIRLDRVSLDIPKPLAELIHRLLEKNPQNRIATALATRRQLTHVRDLIKNDSGKSTQVVPAENPNIEVGSTFVDSTSQTGTGERSEIDTSEVSNSKLQATAISDRKDPDGNALAPGDPPTPELGKKKPDYFNEVTPQQRERKSTYGVPTDSADSTSSTWPLVLGLFAVLAIAGIGIWFALFQQPSRDELLATIRGGSSYPVKVSDEILQFLKAYPEDEAHDEVAQLYSYVEILRYRNNLRARNKSSVSSPLSKIELEFLEVANYKSDKAPAACEELNSLLTFHGTDNSNRSVEDGRAVEMARKLLEHLQPIAKYQMGKDQQVISDGLVRARRSNNREDAQSIYNYIIDEFGDDEWTSELVETARKELTKLENSKPVEENKGERDQDKKKSDPPF